MGALQGPQVSVQLFPEFNQPLPKLATLRAKSEKYRRVTNQMVCHETFDLAHSTSQQSSYCSDALHFTCFKFY